MAFTGGYIAMVEVRQTAATAAGSKVWTMRGPSTGFAWIRRIRLRIGFDGVSPATGVSMRYGLFLGTGAATASGGASLSSSARSRGYQTSRLQDVRWVLAGTALTTTGITYDTNPFHVLQLPTASEHVADPATGSASLVHGETLDFGGFRIQSEAIRLGPNDHLTIGLHTNDAIVGQTLCGSVDWDEDDDE